MKFKDVAKIAANPPSNALSALPGSRSTSNFTPRLPVQPRQTSKPTMPVRSFLADHACHKFAPPDLLSGDDLKDLGIHQDQNFRRFCRPSKMPNEEAIQTRGPALNLFGDTILSVKVGRLKRLG